MARWYKEAARLSLGQHPTLLPSWRYYVHVCSFTFVFSSPDEIPPYIEHYQTKILPSSRMDMSTMPPTIIGRRNAGMSIYLCACGKKASAKRSYEP